MQALRTVYIKFPDINEIKAFDRENPSEQSVSSWLGRGILYDSDNDLNGGKYGW